MKRTPWAVTRRASNPDELVAQPAEDHMRGILRRYILYNDKTRSASFKEVGEPLIFLGNFDTIQDAIKHVMRKLL